MILIPITIVLILILWIVLYNTVIRAKNQVDNAFASIDVMLKKRFDLIPNLVETVKAYMVHEREVLTDLTKLRSQYMSDKITDSDKISTGNKIERTLGSLQVAVENYPDLKASQNFIDLQKSMNEAEEQIAAARRFFNAAVTDYNNKIQQFPNTIIAKIHKFQVKTVFEIPTDQRENYVAKNLFAD